MRCPNCSHTESKVLDSRATDTSIRRRRECQICGTRFTTFETIEQESLLVVKKDGSRQPFDKSKILGGLRRACYKRPVSADTLERLTAEIERELSALITNEVPASYVGELVMQKLRLLDDVAFVRFASVYRDFRDTNDFVRLISATNNAA
jgi:transcriptional repressor NrdR